MKRCKKCGALDNRTTIYKETGLCMDCQTDWQLENDRINDEKKAKKVYKEKDFYKGL